MRDETERLRAENAGLRDEVERLCKEEDELRRQAKDLQIRAERAEHAKERAELIGLLSTQPDFEGKHPQEVEEWWRAKYESETPDTAERGREAEGRKEADGGE